MHFAFIPYGMKDCVDKLIRDMSAQKHGMIFKKEGSPDLQMFVESQIRILPFGVYEYVFPKEDMNLVLTTLLEGNFDADDPPYTISKWKIAILRKALQLKPIPEFTRVNKFLWNKNHVGVIPIGIREDGVITEPALSLNPGYTHERI